jgi:hypothetical protein
MTPSASGYTAQQVGGSTPATGTPHRGAHERSMREASSVSDIAGVDPASFWRIARRRSRSHEDAAENQKRNSSRNVAVAASAARPLMNCAVG